MIVGGRSTLPPSRPQQRIAVASGPSFGTCSRASIVLHNPFPFTHGDITRAYRGDANAPPQVRSESRSRYRFQRGRPRRLRCSGRGGAQRPHQLDLPTDELRRRTRRIERNRYLNQQAGVRGQGAARARPTLHEPPRRLARDHPISAAARVKGNAAWPCAGVLGGSTCVQ